MSLLTMIVLHFIFVNISKRIGCKKCSRVNNKGKGDLDRFDFSKLSQRMELVCNANDFTTHRYETLRVRAATYTYDTSILSQQYGKT